MYPSRHGGGGKPRNYSDGNSQPASSLVASMLGAGASREDAREATTGGASGSDSRPPYSQNSVGALMRGHQRPPDWAPSPDSSHMASRSRVPTSGSRSSHP